MKIPKRVVKENKEYVFVAVIKDNMYMYENVKTKARTTFSNYDLGLIDNSVIDDKLYIERKQIANTVPIIVYDRLFEKETKYDSIKKTARSLGVAVSTIVRKIKKKEWLENRWFIERVEE